MVASSKTMSVLLVVVTRRSATVALLMCGYIYPRAALHLMPGMCVVSAATALQYCTPSTGGVVVKAALDRVPAVATRPSACRRAGAPVRVVAGSVLCPGVPVPLAGVPALLAGVPAL